MGFFDKIGKGIKGVITGMILGIFLLPIGIAMQYCSANQMKYDKVFAKAQEVSSSSEVSGTINIKTRGSFSFENGAVPYEGEEIKTDEGDIFEGQYITFNIQKYKIKETKTQKKDKDGNDIPNEYTYSYNWESVGNPKTSSQDIVVKVNGFSAKFQNFRQNYIPSKSLHYQYKETYRDPSVRSLLDSESTNKIDVTTYNKNSSKPSATEDMYKKYGFSNGLSNFYVVEFTGKVYNPGAQMTLCGKTSGTELSIIEGGSGGKMLAVSYSDFTGTESELKASAKAEGIMKFVIGTICFVIGFAGLFGPIIKVLDFIPFLGDLAIGVIYFILIVVSLLLSILFYVFFKFFWVLVALAILIPLTLFIINKVTKKA